MTLETSSHTLLITYDPLPLLALRGLLAITLELLLSAEAVRLPGALYTW